MYFSHVANMKPSAFTSGRKLRYEPWNFAPPQIHLTPYMTGGLQRLLRRIKTDGSPILSEGCYTNLQGQFDPKGKCVLGSRYTVIETLDVNGQTAVLVRAQDEFSHRTVVIKILHSRFFHLGAQESQILWNLAQADPLNHSHTVRILTTFAFDNHYCLVFEPMIPQPLSSVFRNIPDQKKLGHIRHVGLRLLASIGFLHQQHLIHADLKPDNILFKNENDLDSVHIVDFGNAINYIHTEMSLYHNDFDLQTPLYRAPEVIYGLPFGPEIDMWSLGCILAELVIGRPLFLGSTLEGLIEQITSLLGLFPAKFFGHGKFFRNFKKYTNNGDQTNCTLKLMDMLQCIDIQLADLISQMLTYNPEERITVSQAARHPFFASHIHLGFLSGNTCVSPSDIGLTERSYKFKPKLPFNTKKQPLVGNELILNSTSELHNLKETSSVIKPKPVAGKYNAINSKKSVEIFGKNSAGYDDLVRNRQSHTGAITFTNVIRNDTGYHSRNITNEMASLQEAIRKKREIAKKNLECRESLEQSRHTKENNRAFSTEFPRGKDMLKRPCPLYARNIDKQIVNRGFRFKQRRGITELKENVREKFNCINKSEGVDHLKINIHQKVRTSQNSKSSNRNHSQTFLKCDERYLSSQTEDTYGQDSSLTADQSETGRHRYQSFAFRNDFVGERNSSTESLKSSSDEYYSCKLSDSSKKSEKKTLKNDHSVISGYKFSKSTQDDVVSSDYKSDSHDSLTNKETLHFEYVTGDTQYSGFSNKSRKMQGRCGVEGKASERTFKKEIEYPDNESKFSRSHEVSIVSNTETDVSKNEKMVSRTASLGSLPKKHLSDQKKNSEVALPYIYRKRQASEIIIDSEDEELILLSPMHCSSNKKKWASFGILRHMKGAGKIKMVGDDEELILLSTTNRKKSGIQSDGKRSDPRCNRSLTCNKETDSGFFCMTGNIFLKDDISVKDEQLDSRTDSHENDEKFGVRSVSHENLGLRTVFHDTGDIMDRKKCLMTERNTSDEVSPCVYKKRSDSRNIGDTEDKKFNSSRCSKRKRAGNSESYGSTSHKSNNSSFEQSDQQKRIKSEIVETSKNIILHHKIGLNQPFAHNSGYMTSSKVLKPNKGRVSDNLFLKDDRSSQNPSQEFNRTPNTHNRREENSCSYEKFRDRKLSPNQKQLFTETSNAMLKSPEIIYKQKNTEEHSSKTKNSKIKMMFDGWEVIEKCGEQNVMVMKGEQTL